jgi:putative membrane protein
MNISILKYKKHFGRAGLLVLAAALAAVQPGSAAVAVANGKTKSETVYAVLGNDGSYSGATVVNCFLNGGDITDYGRYDSIKNISGPDEPVVEDDSITWPAKAGEPFYYEGETKKPLPISVRISYYLNGEQEKAEDILGKSGELKIEITLRNETGTGEMDESVEREVLVPLAASVSLTLDNDRFTVLDVPANGTAVLAGSQYTLSYASFPLPEDTFSFTVFGQDIKLDPINIVVLPKSPPGLDSYGDYVDVDGLSEGADDMISGADDMEGGTGDLLSALRDLKKGVVKLENAMGDLSGGAKKLSGGTNSLYSGVKQLKASANAFYSGMSEFAAGFAAFNEGMGQLGTNVADMASQLAWLKDGAAQLDSNVDSMKTGLASLLTKNSDIINLANSLSADAEIIARLQQQQNFIDISLVTTCNNLKYLSERLSAYAGDFYTAFSTTFAVNVQQLSASSGQLYSSCLELLNGAYAIDQGCSQLVDAVKELQRGADGLSGGAAEIANNLPVMADGIDEMISGVEDLKDGIAKLNDDGLKELKGKFDGLKGYLDKLSEKAAGFGSFIDERNSEYSTVQFVLKTRGIGEEG